LNSIIALKNKHLNSDIYVIGSGPSLSFIDPSFFDNKIVVCINYTIEKVSSPELYLVAKEPSEQMQIVANQKNATIVMCERHSGVPKNSLNIVYFPERTYIFEPMIGCIKNRPDKMLERSSSTIVTGMHLAAFMGAKNIMLVGHDCGWIDKEMHCEKYNKKDAVMRGEGYIKWMKSNKVEQKSIDAKKQLKQFYKCNVYSINPFINFNLENHKFKTFIPK